MASDMLIPYILSGSITVLSQRSMAASKDARSGRPGLAPRPADPAVNVPWVSPIRGRPGGPAVGRIPEFLANTGAGDIALAARAGSGQEAPDRFLGAIIVPVWRPASGCTRHPRRRGSVRRVGFRERRGLGRGRRHAGSPAGITPNARRALTRSARLASCECQLSGLESGRSVLCRV